MAAKKKRKSVPARPVTILDPIEEQFIDEDAFRNSNALETAGPNLRRANNNDLLLPPLTGHRSSIFNTQPDASPKNSSQVLVSDATTPVCAHHRRRNSLITPRVPGSRGPITVVKGNSTLALASPVSGARTRAETIMTRQKTSRGLSLSPSQQTLMPTSLASHTRVPSVKDLRSHIQKYNKKASDFDVKKDRLAKVEATKTMA